MRKLIIMSAAVACFGFGEIVWAEAATVAVSPAVNLSKKEKKHKQKEEALEAAAGEKIEGAIQAKGLFCDWFPADVCKNQDAFKVARAVCDQAKGDVDLKKIGKNTHIPNCVEARINAGPNGGTMNATAKTIFCKAVSRNVCKHPDVGAAVVGLCGDQAPNCKKELEKANSDKEATPKIQALAQKLFAKTVVMETTGKGKNKVEQLKKFPAIQAEQRKLLDCALGVKGKNCPEGQKSEKPEQSQTSVLLSREHREVVYGFINRGKCDSEVYCQGVDVADVNPPAQAKVGGTGVAK